MLCLARLRSPVIVVETLCVSQKPMLSHLIFRYKYATGIFASRENPSGSPHPFGVDLTKGVSPLLKPHVSRTKYRKKAPLCKGSWIGVAKTEGL